VQAARQQAWENWLPANLSPHRSEPVKLPVHTVAILGIKAALAAAGRQPCHHLGLVNHAWLLTCAAPAGQRVHAMDSIAEDAPAEPAGASSLKSTVAHGPCAGEAPCPGPLATAALPTSDMDPLHIHGAPPSIMMPAITKCQSPRRLRPLPHGAFHDQQSAAPPPLPPGPPPSRALTHAPPRHAALLPVFAASASTHSFTHGRSASLAAIRLSVAHNLAATTGGLVDRLQHTAATGSQGTQQQAGVHDAWA
jgi:hypothetical protein